MKVSNTEKSQIYVVCHQIKITKHTKKQENKTHHENLNKSIKKTKNDSDLRIRKYIYQNNYN